MGSVCASQSAVNVVGAVESKSAPKEDHDEEINDHDVEDETQESATLRLLLLGAAESGKTTLLEQIRMVCNQDFSEMELFHRKSFIYANIVHSMKCILAFMKKQGMDFANPINKEHADIVTTRLENHYCPFNEEQYRAIESLWKDANVQLAYDRRGEYNLNDSAKYFFENLPRINNVEFQPTPQDLIMTYVPTIGVQNVIFSAKNQSFQLFDMGGQKIDRRKWATMYDGIDAIFFCMAISEYDQMMVEDQSTNRLQDSLNLLGKISSEPKFLSTPIFLFLNETDVFYEKLKRVPLAKYITDFTGTTEKEALQCVEAKARERCSKHQGIMHVYYTCAINQSEMAKTLDKVFKKLLKEVR
uniref:G-protein alpha subunit n=1 Tax=Steinernema glaseri TaxID=37863 RepID=A0A1I8AEI3_9BILA